jgi:hypothetical protein
MRPFHPASALQPHCYDTAGVERPPYCASFWHAGATLDWKTGLEGEE